MNRVQEFFKRSTQENKQFRQIRAINNSLYLQNELQRDRNFIPFQRDLEYEINSVSQYGRIEKVDRQSILAQVRKLKKNVQGLEDRISLYELYYFKSNSSDKIFPVVLRAKITKNVIVACSSGRLSMPSSQEFQSYFHAFGFESDKDLQKGHILANSLGGPNTPWNFFPQPKSSNIGGEWRQIEIKLEKWISDGSFRDDDYIDWNAWIGHCFTPDHTALVGTVKIAAIWRDQRSYVKNILEYIFEFQDHPEISHGFERHPNTRGDYDPNEGSYFQEDLKSSGFP
uniref:CSON015227 protein n=1 Tax=Culicoides sonorensis TaxID=179676 RepID=A0A336KSP3_CULSO